ncbi:hypothetical protein Vretimale_13109 [Volvox reticuliferus]|uniref:Uncharacterized protein n=1 Tax=Volvox reticuliferus TaxID=1737510 RepID=A0A8J4LTQ4_9CHLO|nr:hypothetical protein Vretimale_13109 [Volvox reticuliferus]
MFPQLFSPFGGSFPNRQTPGPLPEWPRPPLPSSARCGSGRARHVPAAVPPALPTPAAGRRGESTEHKLNHAGQPFAADSVSAKAVEGSSLPLRSRNRRRQGPDLHQDQGQGHVDNAPLVALSFLAGRGLAGWVL